MRQLFPVLAGAALLIAMNGGEARAARTRDVCIASPTGGGTFNTFVFRGVESLNRGEAIALHGFYFSTGAQKLGPLHGSAMMGSDGRIRIGFFVHSTAESINDFTVSGVTDEGFIGTLAFDNDGDYVTNGTLVMQAVDCGTIAIP
jgi:hypothetical protein